MRRCLVLMAAILLLVSLAVVRAPSQALADDVWCFDDPTLVANGAVVHFNVAVPRSQRDLVDAITLTVVVPANVFATLSGTNAAKGIGPTHVTTTLVSSGTYAGTGPIPVSAVAVVLGEKGIPTKLVAWQPPAGDYQETAGRAGSPMRLSLDVR